MIELKYDPRPQFVPYHDRTRRWSCIVAHRRAGKTVSVVNDMIARALYTRKKNARYAYIAPYYGQAKIIAWDYLKRGTEGFSTKVMESELSITLVNGSSIRLFGGDNIDALRGIYLDGAVLDEFADMNPSIWGSVIRPLLTDRKGWATFIGTPKGHNAFYDIREHARKDEDWFYLELKASETGLIAADELEDARRTMTDDQYAQEFECDFEAAIQGAYYGAEMKAMEVDGRITDVEYEPEFLVSTYWDIGRNDSTVIWFAQEIAGEVRVIDLYAAHGEDVEHYADLIKLKPYTYDCHWLPHDAKAKTLATKRSVVEQLVYDHELKCRVVPRLDLLDGIQATRKMLKRTVMDKTRCYTGIEALKVYQQQYDEDKKVYRDRPLHNWASDYADGFRQMALVINPSLSAPESDARRRATVGRRLAPPMYTLNALFEDHERNRRLHAGRIS